jgi:tRNA-modifying protein YgfZ
MPTAHLDDRAVVRIAGPDAKTLLQNVVTLDMESVDRHGSGYGALLTPQGKILFDFVLHKAPDGYAADVQAGEAEAFAKRLSLYKLRAKVEIALVPELAVYAAWDGAYTQGGGYADPRLATLGNRWLAQRGSVATDTSAPDWHRHRIALSIPQGGVDFVFGDSFPFDAGMDSLHGVAFDKGCYIGQEVVSRMRHRGTARRRIVAIESKGSLPEPGADIVAGERVVGRLGSSAGGKGIGLVRLDRLHAALDERLPVRAGAEELAVALPAWATYGWPATASVGED